MKKNLLAAIALFSFTGVSLSAQSTASRFDKCAVMQHEEFLDQQNPNRAAERQTYDQNIQNYIDAHPGLADSRSLITIPIVVHLVYKTAGQNISDGQIQSQITVLNQDWTRTNADASNTPAVWTSIAGNIGVNFCLATIDPFGNATTGIERRNTTITSFSTNDDVKHFSTGGLDAWDPHNYLNIWVCNMSGGILGYGEFPTANVSQTFGVVIQFDVFGSQAVYPSGTYLAEYNLGRTTTHEFSHCFNLHHIWGDDNGACTGSDFCGDTPNQADATFGSPSGVVTDACSPSSPGIMYENYMDYSDDVVMNLFTNNQKSRMLAVLNSAPYNTLLLSNRCGVMGVTNISLSNGFNIHPSPTDGAFTLDFQNASPQNFDITIFNVLGEMIYTHHYDALNEAEVHLDLQGNPSGIYFVEVRNARERITKKIVLN